MLWLGLVVIWVLSWCYIGWFAVLVWLCWLFCLVACIGLLLMMVVAGDLFVICVSYVGCFVWFVYVCWLMF